MTSARRLRALVLSALVACSAGGAPPGEHAGHEPAAPALPAAPAHPPSVTVSPAAAAALGIRTVPARAGDAATRHRAPAVAAYDPERTTRVTLLAGGQLRELHVPRVGEPVRAGRVLARAWLPEVRAAFAELLLARDLGEPWLGGARGRLVALGVPAAEVDAALATGTVPDTWTVRAPVSGVVAARPVDEGAWLGAGAVVAVLADPAALVVEVTATGDLPAAGAPVTVEEPASGRRWTGKADAALPTADAAGRRFRVQLDGAEPPGVGRPLVATWEGPAVAGVWVPRGAVVDTGERRVVFVDTGEAFAPRDVVLGARTADEIQVIEGLAPGEAVVAAGTFLFDADTQMVGGHGHGG